MPALIPVPGNFMCPVTGDKYPDIFVAGVSTTHIAVVSSLTVIVPAATFVGTTHESPKILAGPLKTVVVVADVILTVFMSTVYPIIFLLSRELPKELTLFY